MLINAINGFCNAYDGTVINAARGATQVMQHEYTTVTSDFGQDVEHRSTETVITVVVTGSYVMKMDGSSPENVCGGLLRKIVDECDTQGENDKQGGKLLGEGMEWIITVTDTTVSGLVV